MRAFWIIIGVLLVLILVLILMIPRPRIIARAVAPDGTEMRIVQQSRLFHELPWFHTYFIYRKTNGQWRGLQYDHEDYFWFKSRVVFDTNKHTATFLRGSQRAIIFDWSSEEVSHQRNAADDTEIPINKNIETLTNYSGDHGVRISR